MISWLKNQLRTKISSLKFQASDQEDSIIDETPDLSTVRDRIWSKSKRYNIPQVISPSDSEDEIPRSLRLKRA